MTEQYLGLLEDVLERGSPRMDRTGVGTKAVFGRQIRYDLSEGFPLLTTKELFTKGIFHELLWFLRGETNIKSLNEQGVTIWNDWADEDGELGPIYGYQWRSWPDRVKGESIDQISQLLHGIKKDPYSRRHIVSAWNVADIEYMALPPCHCLFQFFVAEEKLSCQLYQRSGDVFLGVPFNIASYALFTSMIAQVTGLKPGDFVHTFGDVHLYNNHFEQARKQLERTPKELPRLVLNPDVKNLFDFRYEDIKIEGYDPHPHISAPIAV